MKKKLLRKITGAALAFFLLAGAVPCCAHASTIAEDAANLLIKYPEEPGEIADEVYSRLMEFYDNPLIVCAFMGNMYRESDMTPWRWEGDDSDDGSYSAKLNETIMPDLGCPDDMTRYYFTHFSYMTGLYGFGLCQWTDIGRKLLMYDMAVETGRRLDDVSLQCDFLIWEMQNHYPELDEELREIEELDVLCNRIASTYERCHPGQMSITVRYAYAAYYYEQYTGEVYEP